MRSDSRDHLDSLSLSIPIGHRSWQFSVFGRLVKLFCKSLNTVVSMCSIPSENVANESVSISPGLSKMSCLSWMSCVLGDKRLYCYSYIYNVMTLARISLTLSRHSSLFYIAFDRFLNYISCL